MRAEKKIALVLSSGGARGNAHIGAIREFIARGYKISSISGSSMGAVIGGVYAAGKLDEFTDWLCSLHKIDVFSLMDFTLNKQGFVKADKVFNEIKKFIPDVQIEQLNIPFSIVATDLKKRETVVFKKGSLFKALRASVAIPAIITPVKTAGKFLVDGGVLAPIPVQYVERNGSDLLAVVNVNARKPVIKQLQSKTKLKPDNKATKYLQLFQQKISMTPQSGKKDSLGFFNLVTNSSNLMISQISKLTLDLHKPDILVEVSGVACETYDFFRAKELIELGRIETAISLDRFEKNNNYV